MPRSVSVAEHVRGPASLGEAQIAGYGVGTGVTSEHRTTPIAHRTTTDTRRNRSICAMKAWLVGPIE
jgi:hypothetical protein